MPIVWWWWWWWHWEKSLRKSLKFRCTLICMEGHKRSSVHVWRMPQMLRPLNQQNIHKDEEDLLISAAILRYQAPANVQSHFIYVTPNGPFNTIRTYHNTRQANKFLFVFGFHRYPPHNTDSDHVTCRISVVSSGTGRCKDQTLSTSSKDENCQLFEFRTNTDVLWQKKEDYYFQS